MRMITGAILVLAAAVLFTGTSISVAVSKEYFKVFGSADQFHLLGELAGIVLLVGGLALVICGLAKDGKP